MARPTALGRLALLLPLLALAPGGIGAEAPYSSAPPVATLLPYFEDALRPLAPRARLVAAVRRDLHHPPEAPLADLGSPHSPNVEVLAASGAEIVVGERMLHAALAPEIARAGAELVLVDSSGVEPTFGGLLEVGRRAGVEQELASAVSRAREALASLHLDREVPILALFGVPGSFLAFTPRTWLGDLLRAQGFRNVAAELDGRERFPGFAELSDEVVGGLRPELVVIVAHGDADAIRAAFLQRLAPDGPWGALRASAVRGVHVLPERLFTSNPGLAMPDAARVLRELASRNADVAAP
jgi:iron complex transport system substrate-binding protein